MLGFDGATWNIINSLIEGGDLPGVRRIMENGVHARLRTTVPLFTPIIWTTIYTGADWEKHGIRNFFNTANDIKVPRIWDVLLHDGRTAGLVGNYFTYPINKKLSFCIPSHFDHGTETYPERYSFIRQIARDVQLRDTSPGRFVKNGFSALRNGLRLRSVLFAIRSIVAMAFNRNYLNTYHRMKRISMDLWFDAFFNAYKKHKPDFASYYSPLPDTISHQYWSFHEPEKFENIKPRDVGKYKEVIRDTYRHCDRLIRKVLKGMPPNTQVCLVSDHGFKALEDPGGITAVVPEKLTDFLGVKGRAVITLIGLRVFIQAKSIELSEKLLKILSEAYIYDTKEPVFRALDFNKMANTIRFCINVRELKDINTRVVLDDKVIPMKDIARTASPWTGTHDDEDGVFILSGPGVMNNGRKAPITTLDITPTLLRLQGIDITEYSDGKIRNDMIDQTWAKANPARAIKSYEDIPFKPAEESKAPDQEIAKKLKSLGYM